MARPLYRYELLMCIRHGRDEMDAGRADELSPLLGRVASLPDELVREHVLPFLVGVARTEDDAAALFEMGEAQLKANDYTRAAIYFRKALPIFSDLGNVEVTVKVMMRQVALHRKVGEHERALELFESAMELYVRANAREGSEASAHERSEASAKEAHFCGGSGQARGLEGRERSECEGGALLRRKRASEGARTKRTPPTAEAGR
jgi:tetratricopeptide (TPR) repeat protein